MADTNGKPLDPAEVAALAPDDPRRAAFAATLTDPALRASWEREWAQSDDLRQTLARVEPPADLVERLLAIPNAPLSADATQTRGPARTPFNWRAVAAMLLVAGIITAVWLWQPWTPRPQPIAEGVRKSISVWAVKNTDRPLDVASADAATVQKKLESFGMDFPVLMLTPTSGVTLQGGGTCDFGTAKAVYTRWAGDGYTCTLYEFNGKDVGAPPIFNLAAEVPQELWHDDMHYRVMIFPGQQGKCCWALVMDTDKARNNFAQYTTGTY